MPIPEKSSPQRARFRSTAGVGVTFQAGSAAVGSATVVAPRLPPCGQRVRRGHRQRGIAAGLAATAIRGRVSGARLGATDALLSVWGFWPRPLCCADCHAPVV
jgi:hypothetical protein